MPVVERSVPGRGISPRPNRGRRGQSLVEFALILPLFLFVCGMAIDFGRLYYAYVAVENAAKEGALYGARNPICATDANPDLCPDPNNVTAHVVNEAPNLPGLAPSVIECIPSGSVVPRDQLDLCARDDSYHVRATYTFQLVTPLLGNFFSGGIRLQADATSTVLNLAYDPTPGASLTKYACFGAGCTAIVTPSLDLNNDPTYVTGDAGAQITYQITATNVGGQPLTGISVTDTNQALPFGTANCPMLPASLAVGSSWQCRYTLTAPNTNGQPYLLYSNTATLQATEIQQRQATAVVKVIALPAGLSVAKNVSPYRLGGSGNGPWVSSPTINVSFNSLTGTTQATVWYQLIVSNPGGSATTSLALTDALNGTTINLPTNADCPALPASLAAGGSWTCLYSAPYSISSPGTNENAATATASDAASATATATVNASVCGGTDLVVPNLIGGTKAAAQAAWTSAGFPVGQLSTWTGHTSAVVATQNVQAFSCVAPTTTMTVTR